MTQLLFELLSTGSLSCRLYVHVLLLCVSVTQKPDFSPLLGEATPSRCVIRTQESYLAGSGDHMGYQGSNLGQLHVS